MYNLHFGWGKCVGSVLENSGKLRKFLTCCLKSFVDNGKLVGFTTVFTTFFHGFFHYENMFFQSVNYQFLPTFNNTYKYNNDI